MVTNICLKYILSYRVYTSLSWLHYYSMLALHDRPVLEMVSLLFLELYQLLQYSYERATSLIEKMVSNQGWSDDRLQLRQRGMHSDKEADMLAMKIDLLLKKFWKHFKCKHFKPWKLAHQAGGSKTWLARTKPPRGWHTEVQA